MPMTMRAESFSFETSSSIQPYPKAQTGASVSISGHEYGIGRVTSGARVRVL
jgi:hypothetical protein